MQNRWRENINVNIVEEDMRWIGRGITMKDNVFTTKNCDWKRYGFCKLETCIKGKCDLYYVAFESKPIQKKIKEEIKWVKKNKDSKKKKDLQDKIMGIKVLTEGYRKTKRIKK